MSTHFTADELSAAAEGLLTGDQAAEIDRHVASCSECTAAAVLLGTVRAALADLAHADTAPMPAAVADRLDAAMAAESDRRASGEAAADLARKQAEHAKRLSTGSFGENTPTKRHTGIPAVDGPTPRVPRITTS